MITIKAGDNDIELFGSIKELPVKRYKVMQQYLLQDSGIGSDIEAIDERMTRLVTFMEAAKHDEAKEELANLRYTFFSAISGLDFKTKAFACLVSKVNGKPAEDLSSDGLNKIAELFDNISVEEMEKHWELIKKKLIQNSVSTSPDGSAVTLNTLKD